MKRLLVTAATVRVLGACDRGVQSFAAVYPRGIRLTDDQEENFKILSSAHRAVYDSDGHSEYDHAWAAWWLAKTLNPDNGDSYWAVTGTCLYNACGVLADAVGVYLKANPGKAYRGR